MKRLYKFYASLYGKKQIFFLILLFAPYFIAWLLLKSTDPLMGIAFLYLIIVGFTILRLQKMQEKEYSEMRRERDNARTNKEYLSKKLQDFDY